MISPHHGSSDTRAVKNGHPSSANLKRKNIDYTMHTPMPTHNVDYNSSRKEGVVSGGSNAVSPNSHYYHPKLT